MQKRGGSSADAEIMVQLPGVDDPAHVKQILQEQAKLELYEVLGGPYGSQDQARQDKGGILPLNSKLVPDMTKGGVPPQWWLLARRPEVRGQDIRDASAQQNTQNGSWETSFVLSQDAAKSFEQFTAAHDNDRGRLAIVLDDRVLSAPTIHSKITDNGVIEGMPAAGSGRGSGAESAGRFAAGQRRISGAAGSGRVAGQRLDPRRFVERPGRGGRGGVGDAGVLQTQRHQRGAGAGAERADSAGGVELFWRGADAAGHRGSDSDHGYGGRLECADFRTYPGRARAGKAVLAAVEAGFNKAFLTIIDTHVTTVVSCAMLFLFGTGPVQGFAVTLVIGLVANVFTAVFVSRTIFHWELGGQKQVVTLSI